MNIVELTPRYKEKTFEPVNCFEDVSYSNMKYLCGDREEKFNLFINTKRVKQSCDEFPKNSDILIIDPRPKFFNFTFSDLDYNIFKNNKPKKVLINLASEGGIGGFYEKNVKKALDYYLNYFQLPTQIITQNELVARNLNGVSYFNICLSRKYFLDRQFPCTNPQKEKYFYFNYICGTLIGGDGIRSDKIKAINFLSGKGLLNHKMAISSSLYKKQSLASHPRLKSLRDQVEKSFVCKKTYEKFKYQKPYINGKIMDDKLGNNPIRINPQFYYNSYLSLVQETEASDYSNRFTEKIMKCIAMKHPFILIGNTGALKLLKSHGFKTFEGLIDESYDDEGLSLEQKLELICSEVQRLNQFSHEDWFDFYLKTEDIREHNHRLFYSDSFQEKLVQEKYSIINNEKNFLL